MFYIITDDILNKFFVTARQRFLRASIEMLGLPFISEDLIAYFSVPGKPVTGNEFLEFWASCSLNEINYFLNTTKR